MKIYKTAAFLILLVVLVCLYSWWSSASVIEQSIQNNRVLTDFDVERYIFWRGENAFRDFLAEKSKSSDFLFFDGHNRWAYILKSQQKHNQDNLDVCQFGQLNGPRIDMAWRGPIGTWIKCVEFHPDKVEITIAKTVQGDGQRTSIVSWEMIGSETGSGHLKDYFSDTSLGILK